jgi:hypothetical protein
MNSTKFLALYEAAIIRDEQTLWADITRRENSFLGRVVRSIKDCFYKRFASDDFR